MWAVSAVSRFLLEPQVLVMLVDGMYKQVPGTYTIESLAS